MAHEVFISHASEDREVADKVCGALESGGIKCWIAPRDIPFGATYEAAIVRAIYSSRLVVLILSAHSNESLHVEREIQSACADNFQKPIVPVRIGDFNYSKVLLYYLGSAQWLDASTPPLEQHLGRLVEHVRASLSLAGDAAQDTRPEASDAHVMSPMPTNPPEVPRLAAVPHERDASHAQDAASAPADVSAGRRTPTAALVGAGVIALLLVAVLVAIFAMRGGRENVNTLPANNANVSNATPTPQRTPTPTPTPSASPTPSPRPPIRNVNRPLNFNLRRPTNRNN